MWSEPTLATAADCAQGNLVFDDPTMYGAGSAKWSRDGAQVAFAGARSTATAATSARRHE